MSISMNDTHLEEVKGYYELLTECAGKSAKIGGFSNLWLAITPLVAWMRAYKAGTATWESWYEVTHAASLMFDDWLKWFAGDMHKPRAEWGGLNELQFKTLLLAIDSGRLTWDDLRKGTGHVDAA